MANRTMWGESKSLAKRIVRLWCDITAVEAGASVTLNRWNYGTFATGPTINTYTAAPATPVPASSAGNYPGQYQVGAEGVMLVTRTGTGLWTIRLQDNYFRLLGLNFFVAAAAGASAVGKCNENTTISNYGAAGGSLIGLAFLDFAGVAVDPIGHVRLAFDLADASEP